MGTRTESRSWRSIVRLLVPAVVFGTLLGLWQTGAFERRATSLIVNQATERGAPAVLEAGNHDPGQRVSSDTGVRSEAKQPAGQHAPAPPAADELAEATALQRALEQEQANDN